jgi:hypothetical protein
LLAQCKVLQDYFAMSAECERHHHCERLFLPKRCLATHNKPDPNSNTVEGSGTVVTLKVPAGLPAVRGRMLTTLPENDEKDPDVSGVRLNTKKSLGKLTVNSSGSDLAFRNDTPNKVDVGVICSPITDSAGVNPGVPNVSDVTLDEVKGTTNSPSAGRRSANVSSMLSGLTAPLAGRLKS